MKKGINALVAVGFIIMAIAPAAAQQIIGGSWEGVLKVTPQMNIRIVLNIENKGGVTTVTLDSPDQNAYGIPGQVKYISADSVNVSVSAIGASYAGRLKDGNLEGVFRQAMAQLPMTMKPGKEELKRLQTPVPPFPYTTEDVAFTTNQLDSYALTGTLTLPRGWNAETPMVVMVTGSGIQNRDEEVAGHRPFAVIADYLARNGIGSLRYDDRGYGAEGQTPDFTTETFAKDARAAVDCLRERKFRKVGVLGHSEGGMIAFMLAADKTAPSFIVTMGAPALRGDSLLCDQNLAILEAGATPRDVTDRYIAALHELYAKKIAHQQIDVDALTAAWPAKLVYAQLRDNLRKIAADNNKWMDYFIAYSPAKSIAATHVPALALYGGKDVQVRASANAYRLRRLNPAVDVRVFPGLNHLMQHAVTGLPTEYAALEETISPEVLSAIVEFIKRQ